MQGFPDGVRGKLIRVPVIVLILVSTVAGVVAHRCAGAALRTWWGRSPGAAVAAEIRERTPVRGFVKSRLDAEVLTGLALTLALAATALAGTVVGLLALAVRQSDALAGVDSAAARSGKPCTIVAVQQQTARGDERAHTESPASDARRSSEATASS